MNEEWKELLRETVEKLEQVNEHSIKADNQILETISFLAERLVILEDKMNILLVQLNVTINPVNERMN
jgi:hypothetical protein